MLNRTNPVRRHTRWPVRWPVLYGSGEFVAEGTILDLTPVGWRVAGPMPVQPGMQLSLRMWPPDKPGGVYVPQATVLWVKGYEFALDVPGMSQADQEWVTQFLDRALGWWLVPRATDHASPSRQGSRAIASPERMTARRSQRPEQKWPCGRSPRNGRAW